MSTWSTELSWVVGCVVALGLGAGCARSRQNEDATVGPVEGCLALDDLPGERCGEVDSRLQFHIEATDSLDDCSVYRGELVRQDGISVDVRALRGLAGTGGLNLFRNRSMTTLSGLDNLQVVREDLLIRLAYSLQSLEGLAQLRSVGGRFWLANPLELRSLEGLESLRCVGSLWMQLPEAIETLAPLAGLEEVADEIDITAPGVSMEELRAFADRFEVSGRVRLNGEVIQEGTE